MYIYIYMYIHIYTYIHTYKLYHEREEAVDNICVYITHIYNLKDVKQVINRRKAGVISRIRIPRMPPHDLMTC